ncbi:MAG: hypothetical protein WA966_09700 [Ornithinimicrobium sp.]
MKRFGAILFWLGLVITIIGVAVSIFGGSRAFNAVSSVVDDAAVMPPGGATVQMDEGETRTIFEQTDGDQATAVCQVGGPDGEVVPLDASSGLSGSLGDVSYAEVGAFEATQAGTYQVQCTGGGTTLISPAVDFGTVGSGALGLIGGILGVGLGLLLLLIGAVLWFIGRSNAKKAAGRPTSAGTYGSDGYTTPPPPPGAGSPPSYGSPEQPRGGSAPPPPPPSNY